MFSRSQALAPIMKRELIGAPVDLHNFFLSRVKANLHIILCLPPSHKLLDEAATLVSLFSCQFIVSF